MTPADISRVLAACAMCDYRFGQPSQEVLRTWHVLLGDLDADEAVEAVRRYYSEHTDRIMPGHVRQGARAIREERRRAEPSEPRALPSRFEEDINRKVRMERGAATVHQVLGPLLEHIAANRPELPTAMDELRALTAGPANTDDVVDGEVRE